MTEPNRDIASADTSPANRPKAESGFAGRSRWALAGLLSLLFLVVLWQGSGTEADPNPAPSAEGTALPAAKATALDAGAAESASRPSTTLAARPLTRISPIQQKNLSGIAWDGQGLWVTVDGEGRSYRVDPETGRVERHLDLPVKETGGLAWDGTSLWQLAYAEKKIYQIDPEDGRVSSVIPSPGEGMCAGMTFDGRHLWLGNWEDGRVFRIDQAEGGKVLESRSSDFETTGLAWDGRYLWNGVLVGTKEHDEATPYTGFVQQRDLAAGETVQALPVHGVFAGGTDWLPGQAAATRMWWYDGFHERLMEFRWGS